MPPTQPLIHLLRALQTRTPTTHQDTPALLSTAASVLAHLSNPLNLTLLSAQLLSAPALWPTPDGLRTCVLIMGVFHNAARAIVVREAEIATAFADGRDPPQQIPGQPVMGGGLSREEWVTAVIKGADKRSPRWRHLLVIQGLLSGFEGQGREGLGRSLKNTVEKGLVTAVNLALHEARHGEEIGAHVVTLVLNWAWEELGEEARAGVDFDHLLPVLVGTSFFSNEGFRSGYFLAPIDTDVQTILGNKLSWSPASSSFLQIKDMSSKPLVSSMGPLARLIAYTVENLQDSWLAQSALDDLLEFTKTLGLQWRNTKLSEVEFAQEETFFDRISMAETLPAIWKLLRSVMFSTIIVLKGIISRLIRGRALASNYVAPTVALQTLHILRNLAFISSRFGSTSFSQFNFVYLTAIDVLSRYPAESNDFIYEIRPTSLGRIPSHPIDRTLDLFFLNAAEQFTLTVSAKAAEDLLIASAAPYLAAGGNNNLLEIFEAAHSVMLSVFSAPQNASLSTKYLPFYVDALFKVFPQNLSARQFRLAFKTLVQISAPPSPISATDPDLPATLLEILRYRALNPSTEGPLPVITRPGESNDSANDETLDERAALALALIDSLPYLPPILLEEWLPLVADVLPSLRGPALVQRCRNHFWETLSAGDMDVERSAVCVAWWGTRGGREMVMSGRAGLTGIEMSGALPAPASISGLTGVDPRL